MSDHRPTSLDYGRWALTGVVLPVAVFLVAYYIILPHFFSDDAVSSLGDVFGVLFVIWFFVVTIAAVWRARKRHGNAG